MSSKRLSIIIGAIDKLSGPMKKISQNIEKVRAPVDKVSRSMNKLKRAAGLREFNRGLKKAARNARAAGNAVGKLAKTAGLIGFASGGAIAAFAKNYADAGDDIAKTSHRLGIGVEALQELRFAADRSGVSVQAFDKAVLSFSGIAGEAARGVGQGAKAFEALGVQFKDSDGNLRGTEAVFIDTLKALEKIENPLQRNSYAMKIWGARGIAMVQMTKDGVGGLEKMQKEFRELGYTMSKEATKAAEEFTDKSTNLGTALLGLRNRIGEKLLPVLNPIIDKLIELAKKVGPSVTAWAEGFAKSLPERLKKLRAAFAPVWSFLKKIGSVAVWVEKNFGLFNTVITVFAGIITFKAVSAVLSLAVAVKALGGAIALTPIGWFIGIVAALVAVGVLLYKNWDRITESISNFARMAAISIAVFSASMSDKLGKAVDSVTSFFASMGDAIWGALVSSFDRLKSFFVAVAQFIVQTNPFTLILKSVNALIKAFSGFDVLATIGSKLQNVLPSWAVNLLDLDGGDQQALKLASSTPPVSDVRTQVGGDIRLHIDSEGRARVKDLKSDNPNVGVVVDVGTAMGGA